MLITRLQSNVDILTPGVRRTDDSSPSSSWWLNATIEFGHFEYKKNIPKCKLRFPVHQTSWLSEWLSTWLFSMGQLSNGGHERNEIWHKGSLGDEDDARTSNTPIVQRKRTIPHSTMKNNRNIIECCNNTHQGAPRTGKRYVRAYTELQCWPV